MSGSRAFQGTLLNDCLKMRPVSFRDRLITARNRESITNRFLPPPVNPAPPDVHLQNAKPANPSEHSDTFVCFAKRVAPSVSLA
ncbi:MAG: hypothetical protein WBW33_36680, partial [Bryobacteraceae bacterium]